MHNNITTEEITETANAIKPTTTQTTNVELSIEEEEQILAMTDDIEAHDNDKPALEQDNKGNQIMKKLGPISNFNKFNPPSSVSLLPTPSTPPFVRYAQYPPRSSLSLSLSSSRALWPNFTSSFRFYSLFNLRPWHTSF